MASSTRSEQARGETGAPAELPRQPTLQPGEDTRQHRRQDERGPEGLEDRPEQRQGQPHQEPGEDLVSVETGPVHERGGR
jgi:hypothetical protein